MVIFISFQVLIVSSHHGQEIIISLPPFDCYLSDISGLILRKERTPSRRHLAGVTLLED